MLTVQTFLTLGDALLAKSHFDEAGILCTLADENAHLYGGAPFAMPIRLLVMEQDLERARDVLKRIENPDAQESEADFTPIAAPLSPGDRLPEKNNPWEILCIALLFLVPGLALLAQTRAMVLFPPESAFSWYYVTILSPTTVHVFGLIAIAIALALVALYFQTRRSIREDAAAADLENQ